MPGRLLIFNFVTICTCLRSPFMEIMRRNLNLFTESNISTITIANYKRLSDYNEQKNLTCNGKQAIQNLSAGS